MPQNNLHKVALCLPGGGFRGIYTVGFLKAWKALGLEYDFISGTSIGAINAAIFHQEGNTDLLEKIWLGISGSDVYTVDLFAAANPFTPKRSVLSSSPLRATIAKHLDYNKIKANPKPCFVNTTNYSTWQPLTLDITKMGLKDQMVNFILASASVPMAFPPVNWDGDWLVDGGITNNFSIVDSVRNGADTIVVLRPVLPQEHMSINNVIDMFNLSTSVPEEYVIDRELTTIDLINKVQEPFPSLKHIDVVVVQPTTPPPFALLDSSFGGLDRKKLIQDAYDLAYPILKKAFNR